MSEPFLGEIKIISWNYPPRGWAFCNGQLLPINQNQALFSLLGTYYGGDGRVNFGLPNLQGRTPIHMGSGFTIGQLGGEQSHTLNISELPAHTHVPSGTTLAPSSETASNNVWCNNAANPYIASGNAALMPSAIANTGGSQPHQNMSPFLVLNMVVALQGIFPSQN